MVTLELVRRIGERVGREQQRREYDGLACMIELEAIEDYAQRTIGLGADALDPSIAEAFCTGYGEGTEAVQQAEPPGPRKQPALWRFQQIVREILQS
jgi:hypothetical protein